MFAVIHVSVHDLLRRLRISLLKTLFVASVVAVFVVFCCAVVVVSTFVVDVSLGAVNLSPS